MSRCRDVDDEERENSEEGERKLFGHCHNRLASKQNLACQTMSIFLQFYIQS